MIGHFYTYNPWLTDCWFTQKLLIRHWLEWIIDSVADWVTHYSQSHRDWVTQSQSLVSDWVTQWVSQSVSHWLTDWLRWVTVSVIVSDPFTSVSDSIDWLRRLTGFHVPRSGLLNTIPRHSYYCETTGWLCLPVWLCRDRRLGRVSRLLYDKVFA